MGVKVAGMFLRAVQHLPGAKSLWKNIKKQHLR